MEGYDAKFDPPLEKRLECPICLLAQREPMQTPCGHRFCSSCILRALRETGPRCPVDNTRVSNNQLFKDNFAKREVLSLNVRCSADDAGCKWQGELRDLEPHCRYCDLVTIECHNECGHCCQRKDLSSHLTFCPNKPNKCPHCSIYFTCNRIAEHEPHCSKIPVPESILSNIYKASEVLKWCGHLKLKLTGHSSPTQYIQVSGYLTAKSESDECYMFTGNWCSLVNMMPLNPVTSKIFWKLLQGPEVLPKYFTFGFLYHDNKSNMFSKMLKKRNSEQSAVVGLNLKAGPSRPDLTIIYLHWSEQKRKILACVAELKSHLVRQIQNRLQEHYHARRGRSSNHEGPSHSHSRSHPSHSHNNGSSSSQHPHHHHVAMATEPRHHLGPPTQPHFHAHVRHHVHPTHPTAVALVTPQPPHPVQAPTIAAAAPSSEILPSLLSWQMSQSLNTYPWRMQTGSVPFFTFPSTPPSYIPANSYPYTFAAPPFSISPIQPGAATATVAVPSYTGIAVPQVTAVEPIVTLNSAPVLAGAGVVHAAQPPTYPVAAAAAAIQGSGEAQLQNVALTNHNPGAATAVAVGINGATVNVIQQPVIQPSPAHEGSNPGGIMVPAVSAAPAAIHASGHDLAVIHTLGPTHQHFQTNSSLHAARPTIQHMAHAPAALIQTAIPANDESGSRSHQHAPHVHLVRSSLANMANVESRTASVAGPSSVPSQRRRNENSIFVNSHQSRSSAYVSLPSSSTSTPTHSPSSSNSRFALIPRVARPPSPSSGDESDSSTTSSLGENFSTMFYPVPSYSPLTSDSDGLESPDHLSESPNPFSGRESTDILSDGSNNMSEQSDSEVESSSDSSALHTLANAAVILADTPTDEMDSGSSQPGPSHAGDGGEPLRLPVLINISGSDSEQSRVDTPSIIDLTTSPTTSTPSSSLSDSLPGNGSGPASSSHVSRNLQSSLENAASASHGDSHHLPQAHHAIAAPLLLPVIQHQATNVIAANLAVTAQRTNAAPFNAPSNAPPVQLTDHAHRIQDQGPATASVPHANVHILGWPQPAQIINNERLSVRNGAPSTEITHVAVPSGPAVIAQQTPPAQFHAVNVVQSRGNHSMLQRAPGSSAQPQGGFWDTVMPSLDMSLQGGSDTSASRL